MSADIARVLVVMAAAVALCVALTRPEPIWTVLTVLTTCAAVALSRPSSPGAVRGISSLGAGRSTTPAPSDPPAQ